MPPAPEFERKLSSGRINDLEFDLLLREGTSKIIGSI